MAQSAATHPSVHAPSSTGTIDSSQLDQSYGGFTRFELELEPLIENESQFVQALANPYYLNHLASQKLLQDSTFVAYLNYLQYFAHPEYTRYLSYPGPTLKALELLQQERFRQEILSPDIVAHLAEQTLLSSIKAK
ncbi:MAG: hypothetical protein L6R38_005587 [Xanthoria sp. 2 TBL-2021]|nr:MAG: hypothetical protein L6R38_005587 [Xanthoria sp. 2 TBL-2021]